MDVIWVIEELRKRRDAVARAISALELVAGQGERRGHDATELMSVLDSKATDATLPEDSRNINPVTKNSTHKKRLSHRYVTGSTWGHA
jgi:hypothetical protein